MNAQQRVQDIRADLVKRLTVVRESRFLADRLSMGLVVAALGLNVLALVSAVTHLHVSDVGIPVRYSTLRGFYDLGPWYFPLELVAYGLVVTVINVVFAYASYLRSRLASFFLLSGAVVVAIFTLIISGAFGAVVPQ